MLGPQTCKDCGRRQRFEFAVPDELWHLAGAGQKTLCIECWLQRLDRASLDHEFSLADFHFLGVVGDHVHGIVHDAERKLADA